MTGRHSAAYFPDLPEDDDDIDKFDKIEVDVFPAFLPTEYIEFVPPPSLQPEVDHGPIELFNIAGELEYIKEHKKREEDDIAKKMARSLRMEDRVEEDQASEFRGMHMEESVLGTERTPTATIGGDLPFNLRARVNNAALKLPIYESEKRIISSLPYRQIFVIEGFTGCGKTTQVPQMLLENAYAKKEHCRIIVTQPRRIAAISVANRVCEERGWLNLSRELNKVVGYQVGLEKKCTDETALTYVTTGVLLAMLIGGRSLNEWTHVIIDEVHERDLNIDLLCLVIKKLLIRDNNTRTKIILMSATLKSNIFAEYFPSLIDPDYRNQFYPEEMTNSLRDESYVHNGAVIVKIPRTNMHDIKEHYMDTFQDEEGSDEEGSLEPTITEDAYEYALTIIESLDSVDQMGDKNFVKPSGMHANVLETPNPLDLENEPKTFQKYALELERQKEEEERKKAADQPQPLPSDRGAVLVFLPGLYEIDYFYKILNEAAIAKAKNFNGRDRNKWLLLPLHSSITADEQAKAFHPAPEGYRKIILATNIAESSITVADIKYVIDFCLTKSLSCDPTTNFSTLRVEWASKSQCIQRKGRVGRVSSGHCYRMVTRQFFDTLEDEARPEMLIASLENVVLQVKLLGMGSPESLLALALDPPHLSGITRAVANLKEVGALTLLMRNGKYCENDGQLTALGKIIAKLPIDIRLGRLLVLGYIFGLLEESLVIAAGLSTKSPFSYPFARRLESYQSKLTWAYHSFSDCLAIYNLYKTWIYKTMAGNFRGTSSEKLWANKYFVQYSVLREMNILITELRQRMSRLGYVDPRGPSSEKLSIENALFLKIAIAGAFYPNYFIKPRPQEMMEYERQMNKDVVSYNPLRTVTYQGFPSEQVGLLYGLKLANHFKAGQTIPYVDFYASKAIISFDGRSQKIGTVSLGVYRSIKMRQLRQFISFRTVKPQKVTNLINSAEREPENIMFCPGPEELPDARETSIPVIVTHIKDPEEFMVIRADNLALLERIETQIEDVAELKGLKILSFDDFKENLLCITYNDGKFCRARIENLMNSEVLVYLIDYGETLWKVHGEVYAFPTELIDKRSHTTACLAYHCRIQQLKGPMKNGSVYSKDARIRMHKYKNRAEQLELTIYAIHEGIIIGDLCDPCYDLTLRQVLIQNKLGEVAEEAYDIKIMAKRKSDLIKAIAEEEMVHGHDCAGPSSARTRSKKQIPPDRQLIIDDINKQQKSKFFGPQRFVRVDFDDEAEDGPYLTLKGGYSPLELKFFAVGRTSLLKQVTIDGSSVNAVCLNQEPYSSTAKLIVAQTVNVSQNEKNIVLRNTTLMPSIPGIIGLITMLFAPKIEFRTAKGVEHYTGLVSGLGLDPSTKVPIYPDHDIELIFDTLIDNQDHAWANNIRLTMNLIMVSPSRNIGLLQEKIRKDITLLLERERSEITEIWPKEAFAWDQLDERSVISPGAKRDDFVFPPHASVNLNYDEEVGSTEGSEEFF